MSTALTEVLLTDPKRLLLDMGEQRSLDALLALIVGRLAAPEAVALARVWLVRPGAHASLRGVHTVPAHGHLMDWAP